MRNVYRTICVFAIILLVSSVSVAQTELEEVKKKAEECALAFFSGDHESMVNLTYPKLVAFMGGKAKMISDLGTARKDMISKGFDLLSATFETPKEITSMGSKRVALVPYTAKMKMPGGTITQQSHMLGISEGRVKTWTFINLDNTDDSVFKRLLPEAVGKLKLPPKQPPVIERTP